MHAFSECLYDVVRGNVTGYVCGAECMPMRLESMLCLVHPVHVTTSCVMARVCFFVSVGSMFLDFDHAKAGLGSDFGNYRMAVVLCCV